MEFQLSKTTELVSIYDIGETIEIIGFSKVVDGKNKIKNMQLNIGRCQSAIMVTLENGQKLDSDWLRKIT